MSRSVTAVALVLHGGKEHSFDPVGRRNLPGLRMLPIAATLRARGHRLGLVVDPVRYRVRGWNGPEASPVADARAALESVKRRHGDVPVILLGHSMGARTAIRVCDDSNVVAVVGMAPWTPSHEPVAQTAGRRLLLLQGDRDTVTPPHDSLDYARRAAAAGATVARLVVRGDAHPMLRRWPTWHRLAVDFTLAAAGVRRLSPVLVDAYEHGASGDFEVAV
ncbi:MAG TPA: alpha/beta fold hydrolase [Mycobacteriales bacterium]|nr:alpha/beta fold hydrolase [Mycobacteriales bacterium]